MDEAKKGMGIDWADTSEAKFGETSRINALTELYRIVLADNNIDTSKNPQAIKYANVVADLNESELIQWANWIAKEGDIQYIQEFYDRAKMLRKNCRENLGLKDIESPVN